MDQPRASVRMEGDGMEPQKVLSPEQVEAEKVVAGLRRKVVEELEAKVEAGKDSFLEVVIDNGPHQGTIRMHRPSLDEERQIGVRVAKYLQGAVGVDVKTENLAIFFATFDVCADWDSAPAWFKPREMTDYGLLNFVYGRFAEWLRTFRGFVPPEPSSDSEAPKGEEEVVDSAGV